MREVVAEGMYRCLPYGAAVLDVGCGVGTMTQELFKQKFDVTGIDASKEMIAEARQACSNVPYHVLNAVDVTENYSTRAAVVCMVFHEMPTSVHLEVLQSLLRITEEVWVVDVEPSYNPSDAFFMGEPYLHTYLQSIDETMMHVHSEDDKDVSTFEIIPGRVRGWVVRRTAR